MLRRGVVDHHGELCCSQALGGGVWHEPLPLLIGGLQKDYLPSMWRSYAPTLVETGLLAGTIGLFAIAFSV